MGRPLRNALMLSLGTLALLALVGTALVVLSSASGAQRVPALAGVTVTGWRSDEVALAWEQRESEEHHFFFVDVHTGKRTSLPALPPLPKGKVRGDGVRQSVVRSFPMLSPDGQWLLYQETQVWGVSDSSGESGFRWRLVRLADGTARLWPHDGSFQRSPHPELDNHDDYSQNTLWLPDSQGWLVFERLRSGTTALTAHRLPSMAPQPLPCHTSLWLHEVLPSGQGVFFQDPLSPFNPHGPIHLTLLPVLPGSPPAEHLTLPLPRSTWWYQVVSADGPTLLIKAETEVQGISRWLARLRHIPTPQTSTFWRVPKSGQAPQCVLTLGVSVERWALSRDKQRLYYWLNREQAETPEQAFVVPTPK